MKYIVSNRYRLVNVGILLFILLYIIATIFYRGGSDMHPKANTFNWTENYWCDMIQPFYTTGRLNPSSIISHLALLIICSTLILFWNVIATQFFISKWFKIWMMSCSIISMLALFLLLSKKYHNEVTLLAATFGAVPVWVMLRLAIKYQWQFIVYFGMLLVILLLLNFIVFYTQIRIEWLPIMQKGTIFLFLVWTFLFNQKMHTRNIYKQKESKK